MVQYYEHSDFDLTDLIRNGNSRAFQEIYNRYWTVLYLHARRMLRNESQAQDVVQEVFTVFWEKREEMEPTLQVRAYLFAAVKNRILNLFRHEKVAGNYLSALGHVYDEGDYSTDESVNFNELVRLIETEISRLPTEMKKVFELSRKEHLSAREIAVVLNKSEQTVKKQISRVLQILRMKIGLNAPLLLVLLKMVK